MIPDHSPSTCAESSRLGRSLLLDIAGDALGRTLPAWWSPHHITMQHHHMRNSLWEGGGDLARTGESLYPSTPWPHAAIKLRCSPPAWPKPAGSYSLALRCSEHEALSSATSFRCHADYLYILCVDLGSSCNPGTWIACWISRAVNNIEISVMFTEKLFLRSLRN